MLLTFQNAPLPLAVLRLYRRHYGSHWVSKPSVHPVGSAMAARIVAPRGYEEGITDQNLGG